MHIPEPLYKEIQINLPILCVDVLVRYKGKYLLIKRTEEPVKDVFWVIGGRVLKNEMLRASARRKMIEEIGILPYDMEMIGVYEDRYEESSFGAVEGGYHTMAVVFEAFIDSLEGLKLDRTSAEWGLFEEPPKRFKVQSFKGDFYE
jgi:colanic acid biosynthesis protein WcaH